MSDIITADNLPLVITALLTGIAGLAVWRHGGKLGDEAKHLSPPGPPAPALALTMEDAKRIATEIAGVRAVAEAWWEDEKQRREAKDLMDRVRHSLEAERDRHASRGIAET